MCDRSDFFQTFACYVQKNPEPEVTSTSSSFLSILEPEPGLPKKKLFSFDFNSIKETFKSSFNLIEKLIYLETMRAEGRKLLNYVDLSKFGPSRLKKVVSKNFSKLKNLEKNDFKKFENTDMGKIKLLYHLYNIRNLLKKEKINFSDRRELLKNGVEVYMIIKDLDLMDRFGEWIRKGSKL